MSDNEFPQTIYQSDKSWGAEALFVEQSVCSEVERDLRTAFGVGRLEGSWEEWELVDVSEDGNTAKYRNGRLTSSFKRCQGDDGYFETAKGVKQ